MPIILLVIGAILIVAALRDTVGQLGTALGQDVPAFLIWAGAIGGVGAIGFIPGLEKVSKPLIVLVILVLVLANYQAIINGFVHATKVKHAADTTLSPAEQYASNPQKRVTVAQIEGGGTVEQTLPVQIANALGTDPGKYLSAFGGSQSSGFGGTASTVSSGDS